MKDCLSLLTREDLDILLSINSFHSNGTKYPAIQEKLREIVSQDLGNLLLINAFHNNRKKCRVFQEKLHKIVFFNNHYELTFSGFGNEATVMVQKFYTMLIIQVVIAITSLFPLVKSRKYPQFNFFKLICECSGL